MKRSRDPDLDALYGEFQKGLDKFGRRLRDGKPNTRYEKVVLVVEQLMELPEPDWDRTIRTMVQEDESTLLAALDAMATVATEHYLLRSVEVVVLARKMKQAEEMLDDMSCPEPVRTVAATVLRELKDARHVAETDQVWAESVYRRAVQGQEMAAAANAVRG